MKNVEDELNRWIDVIADYHIPRWNELPDIELYMDQLVTLIRGYFEVLFDDEGGLAGITPAMVNNYVKLGLIPPPVRKRYSRQHIAYLIAITILKQVFTTSEIKQGIMLQSEAVGLKNAYDIYCNEQEAAFREVAAMVRRGESGALYPGSFKFSNVTLKMATMALACKTVTSKTLGFMAGGDDAETKYSKNMTDCIRR